AGKPAAPPAGRPTTRCDGRGSPGPRRAGSARSTAASAPTSSTPPARRAARPAGRSPRPPVHLRCARSLARCRTIVRVGNPPPEADGPALFENMNGIALLLLAILAVDAVLSFAEVYLFQAVSQRCMADLRRDTFGRLLRLPLGFHHQHRVGELSSRLVQDLS